MKVVHRLYIMMTPSLVAMLLLAALAYWGQYARAAPQTLTLVGAIVVVVSLGSSWANARYLATRLERLATGGATRGTARPGRSSPAAATTPSSAHASDDEIDAIERVVDRLSGEVKLAETDSAHQAALFERRARRYAQLLVTVADTAARELEEVRLPLHILLENHFGELNENQEEMLGAARAAAEVLDADILSMRQIAEVDLGDHALRNDRIKPSELLEAIRPMLTASAEAAGAMLELDVAPLLPPIVGDAARLQDAAAVLIRAVIATAQSGAKVRLRVEEEAGLVKVSVSGGGRPVHSIRWEAAVRILEAHGGVVEEQAASLTLRLPIPAGAGHTLGRMPK